MNQKDYTIKQKDLLKEDPNDEYLTRKNTLICILVIIHFSTK